MYLCGNLIGTDDDNDENDGQHTLHLSIGQADRGFARSQLCTDEDDTINNLILYTVYGMIHQKRGEKLSGQRIKKEREEYGRYFNPP
jgi:hypothetical protein